MLSKRGRRADAEPILRELQDRSGRDGDMPHALACVYAGLNQHDEAFSSLDRATAVRDPQLAFLLSYPIVDDLRADPRFGSVVQRVGGQAIS